MQHSNQRRYRSAVNRSNKFFVYADNKLGGYDPKRTWPCILPSRHSPSYSFPVLQRYRPGPFGRPFHRPCAQEERRRTVSLTSPLNPRVLSHKALAGCRARNSHAMMLTMSGAGAAAGRTSYTSPLEYTLRPRPCLTSLFQPPVKTLPSGPCIVPVPAAGNKCLMDEMQRRVATCHADHLGHVR